MMTSSTPLLPPDLVTLSDALPTPLILLNRAGLLLHANLPAAHALRYSAESLVGRWLWDVVSGPVSSVQTNTVQPGPLLWLDAGTGEPVRASVVAVGDLLTLTWTDEQAAGLVAARRQALSEVSSALVAIVDSADVVRVVMQAGRQAVGAYGAVVYVLDTAGQRLHQLGASGYGEMLPKWTDLDLQLALPLTESARNAAPLFLDQQTYRKFYPDLPRQSATRSTAVLPLIAGQRTLGVLGLSFDHDHAFLDEERAFLETLANQCAIALERAQAVEAAQQAAKRSGLLAQASEQLTTALSPSAVLDRLTSLVVPTLADWCSVALDDGQGMLALTAVAHHDPELAEQVRNLRRQVPVRIDGTGLVAQVFRSAEARLFSVLDDVSALLPAQADNAAVQKMMQAAPIRSLMLLPLKVRGQTLGILSLMSSTPGYFGPDDLQFAQELARRAALALDNAALLQAAQASEARYRALTEATDQYVWTNSAEGEMIGEQPGWAALTGQTPAEYRGYGWSVRLHEEDRAHAVEAWHDALRLRSKYEVEQRVQVKDGTYRHFLVRAVPLLDDGGQIKEWVGLHSDVTDLRQAELRLRAWNEELERRVAQNTEELRAANAELDAFNHSVSHDLRAPVRHVLGFAGLLRRGAEEKLGAREQRLLTQVETSAQHMNTLIDELLAFARLSREPLRATAVNLSALIGEIQVVLEPEVGTRQIEWHIGTLPVVSGDPQLLKFALINLLSNAVKYTSTRPVAHIEVSGEQRGNEVVVWVRDNGVGFDPKYAGKLFGVFQRLHSQQEFEGVGIGLANVGRIVARHGGRVWAEGEVGVGATFFVSLPLNAVSPRPELLG
ncbi:GAF domain-containing protein [Deinococcus sp. Arct2-2]|uniref:GAF domain-containing sensor histidine kinase n=1 Tax=Deinococcus sp. Arct2-2 TaxID=2568653 RepID=UPI001454BE1C|nr:GAF domain-containing protein [Deinococcus sp. Arct2-2]